MQQMFQRMSRRNIWEEASVSAGSFDPDDHSLTVGQQDCNVATPPNREPNRACCSAPQEVICLTRFSKNAKNQQSKIPLAIKTQFSRYTDDM